MAFNLQGKVVGVTGSARGIGKAVAKGFVEEGCKLILCDVNAEALAQTKEEFEKMGAQVYTGIVDVSKEEQIKEFLDAAAKHFGGIDIWVNNAGICQANDMMDVSVEEWDRHFNINTRSIFLCSKHLLAHMKDKGGVIINAASWTSILPSANAGVYSATKAANLSLTKTFAAEFAPYNIRVCAYTPGFIITDMTMQSDSQYSDIKKTTRSVAMNRGGYPEDLVGPIVFLASEYASYITGVTLEVSGGKYCVQNPWYMWEKLGKE